MGNSNSSTITINLDRNNSLYSSGEIISGIVDLNITEENLEAKEIYIIVVGEIGYKTFSTGTAQHSTRTEDHCISFYCDKVSFVRPDIGQKKIIYRPGHYSWPFHFSLIDNLPPTIGKHYQYPRVRYYLQVIIDKPWYEGNIRHTKYLAIRPRVNLLQNPRCLLPFNFKNENRKNITLKGTFNKVGYVPGENIQFSLEIQNPRKLLIEHINLSMLQSYEIAKSSKEYTVFKTMLPKIINLKDKHIMETFSIKLPSTLRPPSYKFQGEKINAFVKIYYTLKLTVIVEGVFTNLQILIPSTLGTEPNPDLQQQRQETIDPLSIFYSANSDQSIFTNDDPPPSYDSIVQYVESNFCRTHI